MIQQYPDYFIDFSCIGGACTDSCCIGWEVDIDEESYYYYQTLPGEFGDLIRSRISVSSEGDYYFPMAAHRRCPFLNGENLCDMICRLGPEALCVTCDEYPRYFNRIGDYEQVDVSLSCPEVGRLFFLSDAPFTYPRIELPKPELLVFEEEEPFEPEDLDPEDLDSEDLDPEALDPEALDPEDLALRDELIRERDAMVNTLQCRDTSIEKRIGALLSGCGASGIVPETYPVLLDKFKKLEPLDRKWMELFRSLCRRSEELSAAEAACYEANRERLEIWFEKLAVYFTYRYHLDAYFTEEPTGSVRLMLRSLRMIWLLCVHRWLEQGRCPLTAADIADIAHTYSRQVEHCEDNVDCLKEEA